MSDHIVGRIEFYDSTSPYRTARALKLLQMLESGKLKGLILRSGAHPTDAKRIVDDILTEIQEVTGE